MNLQPNYEDDGIYFGSIRQNIKPVTRDHIETFNPYYDNQYYEVPYQDNSYNNPQKSKKVISYDFYQITSFPNPKTNRFMVIKFTYDQQMIIRKVKQYYAKKNIIDKLFQNIGSHKYKLYPCIDLNQIEPPSVSDLIIGASSNTNNNYNYTGYAPYCANLVNEL
jgi:hypothetical protein